MAKKARNEPQRSAKSTSRRAAESRSAGLTKSTRAAAVKRDGFSDAERAAMKERARELKAEARASRDKADGEREVLATLAALPKPDRALGERLHAIVAAHAPTLAPRLWYGMPAYANAAGKVVCFFQAGAKFKTRYASFAFTDAAKLDEGAMWATGFGVKEISAADEAKIAGLVSRAVS